MLSTVGVMKLMGFINRLMVLPEPVFLCLSVIFGVVAVVNRT